MVLMNLLALHLTLSTLFVMVACLPVYLSLGGVHKLCRLKIGNFRPPPPLFILFFTSVYLVNRLRGYPLPRKETT